ncbi:type VII secretion protein EccE [Actinoplanes sp. TBRC 11911]|uniref:type VII secretion protein EccE n=1 Tax=Actinoplanes sp. TBRC 11911 TaxID=2729386 RepID=UPI00289933B0|nr:type VII secretion protein EccE [Actinoplanes sp. TBRC 11911]
MVTVQVAGEPLLKVNNRPIRDGRITGQVVATQVAVVALLIGALNGPVALLAGLVVAVALLVPAWLRVRGRWVFEWLGVAMRYGGRRHTAVASGLLGFVAPGAEVRPAELAGEPAAAITDGAGLTAVLELGDPTALLAEESPELPSPAVLLPAPATELPPVLIQLLLTGAPAPAVRTGAGLAASSYRQLTDGRLLGHGRALLTVRVLRAEGWSDEELYRSLSGLVRKLARRLSAVPARPLGAAAAARAIAEAGHDDGAAGCVESWPGLRVGGLVQATYRLRRAADLRVVMPRLLALPASATTVSLTAGPHSAQGPAPIDITVRLAAPDPATLAAADVALRKLVAVRRLDGEHLSGLAATLPLSGNRASQAADLPDGPLPPLAPAGLMLGVNRHGQPVIARLFRPEQTRALVVGGARCAQLLTLRAMALGARVVVQTARPQAWEQFVRGAAAHGESITMLPPGRPLETAPPGTAMRGTALPGTALPGTALHPLLVVVDVGSVGADKSADAGWQATLVVRDEFAAADVDAAAHADLLVLQQLRAEEATLLDGALGLGEVAGWMTRIRPDMVGVVHRRAVRWAVLAQTPIETQLLGNPGR